LSENREFPTKLIGSTLTVDTITLRERLAVLEHTEKELRSGSTQLEQEKKDLLEQIQKLRIENAVLTERCTQIEKLEQENRSLKGELSDMRRWPKLEGHPELSRELLGQSVADCWHGNGSAYPENEVSDESHIRGSLSDALSPASITSSWTWISACTGENCFLLTALFKATSASHDFYLRASDLLKGSHVQAYDDETVLEVTCNPERHEVNELIEIGAGGAILPVTLDHRVPVIREGNECTVQAKDLHLQDHVLVNNAYTALTSLVRKIEVVPVVKITFKPDMPVPVFMPPPMIATKGHHKKPLRRSGMNKRVQSVQANVSVPDTVEWWPAGVQSSVGASIHPATNAAVEA